jgi:dipeptidyl aminopeptidase/acylaminoacyl peptidase
LPRKSFFGNPYRSQAAISPSGEWLGWQQPVDGTRNIFIAPRANPHAARQLTFEPRRAAGGFFFAEDDQHIIYSHDSDGDENTHLFAIDIASGKIRDLTPFPGAKCFVVASSPIETGALLVGINNRDPRFHDIWRIEIASGARVLVEENSGCGGYLADRHLILRLAIRTEENGDRSLRRRDTNGEWEDWFSIPMEDSRSTFPTLINAAGTTVYLYDSRERDTACLAALDIASDGYRVLAEDSRADIGNVLYDHDTREPIAYGVDFERFEFHPLGDRIAADIAFLNMQNIGDWGVVGATRDSRIWLIGANSDTKPGVAYIYDRDAATLDVMFHSRPELEGMRLARMYPLQVPTRDGLSMVCYLSLPATEDVTDPGGMPRAARPLPLVVDVHGGPAARNHFGYNPTAQWLANRGYAVLQLNFRGSLGFGKAFLAAGDGEWGAAMSDDVDDAVDFLIFNGIADAARVAITGGSYGGYATLCALTRTPEKYACGVDLVGPSNLETLLASIPPYWESGRKNLFKSVGDPSTEAGLALLQARSPLHKAGAISRPLLIGQGANDPRVKQAEADQMVAALQANKVAVTYALFPDEGHGFGRPANALCFSIIQEAFLARYLGGAFEIPKVDEVAGTTLQCLAGAEWLKEVLPAEVITVTLGGDG